MKNISFILAVALLCFCANTAHGDFDCDEKSLSELPIIGPKMANNEDIDKHKVREFFKNVGCQLKIATDKLTEQAKRLSNDLKKGAEMFGEKAKDLGSDINDKIGDLKERFSSDSSVERTAQHLTSDVEIINPDLLKIDQECGHGYILNALGICSKLRK
ncbi:uncharacterized protein [Eurosta solidaginis]|uniref:uncharacterized protein n=1 Tax=Eurosta solidaginis TaxID=178769 RepID=UPI003530C92B